MQGDRSASASSRSGVSLLAGSYLICGLFFNTKPIGKGHLQLLYNLTWFSKRVPEVGLELEELRRRILVRHEGL